MPPECNPAQLEFPAVDGRAVVASFDGGRITGEAGALLLGATDKVLDLTRRLAGCCQGQPQLGVHRTCGPDPGDAAYRRHRAGP
jgi:hypothetical protein